MLPFVLHGQFYPTLDQVIVEDCFRQAIQKYGVPEAVFLITAPVPDQVDETGLRQDGNQAAVCPALFPEATGR